MKFKTHKMYVPDHWISAVVNGDESSFDHYDDQQDYEAYKVFIYKEIPENAYVDVAPGTESNFMKYHHATDYGVLACNCTQVIVSTPVKE